MIVHIYCINFICTFPIIWNFFLQYYTSVNMNFKIKTKLAKSCITEYNCYQFLIFIDKTLKFFLHKLTNFIFFLINSVSYIVLWNYPEVKLYSINLIQYLLLVILFYKKLVKHGVEDGSNNTCINCYSTPYMHVKIKIRLVLTHYKKQYHFLKSSICFNG